MRLALLGFVAGACVAGGYFALGHPHAAGRFYTWTPQDVRALVPSGILQRIGFMLLAFVPLLFLPFRTPAALAMLLPLAEVLSSRMPTTYTMGSHYAGAWAGWALYAFAIAIGAISARDAGRAHRVLYWCVALCVAEFAAADPLHPGYFLHARAARDVALDNALRTLPRDISIATQEEAYTHLAATDPNATVLPEMPDTPVTACTMLTDDDFPESPRLQEARGLVARLARSGAYRISKREGGITLYTKTGSCR
jgi:hypothetical protein